MGMTIMMVPNGETVVLAVMMGSMLLSVIYYFVFDGFIKRRMDKDVILDSDTDEAILAAEKLRKIENSDRWFQKTESQPLFSIDVGACLVYIITAVLFLSLLISVFIKARENAAKRNSIQMNNSTTKTR